MRAYSGLFAILVLCVSCSSLEPRSGKDFTSSEEIEVARSTDRSQSNTGKVGSIDPEAPVDGHDDQVSTEIGIYAFMTAISGDLEVGEIKAEPDVSFNDILDHLDMGGMGYVKHRRGNWSFQFDVCYLKVSADETETRPARLSSLGSRSLKLDVEFEQVLAEGFVGYRVLDHEYESTRLGIDVLGGLRYNYLEAELDSRVNLLRSTRSSSRDWSKDWLDGVIGARVQYGQDRGWAVSGWADIGRGTSSSSYQLIGILSYDVSSAFKVYAGYRYYNMEYHQDSGISRRKIDLDYPGPVLGVSYTF